MKSTFQHATNGDFVVSYDCPYLGERVTRRFWTREFDGRAGYVRETLPSGKDKQVCCRLGSMGSTLMSTHDDLEQIIRREYAAMRRQWMKDGVK